MTPGEFIAKWRASELKESAASQEHFIDLCRLLGEPTPAGCFHLLDDFHSSGRISGKQRIPLSKLVSGKKHLVEGHRLEVNPSVDRYKREMANLTAAL